MEFSFEYSTNIVEIVVDIFSWALIIYFIYYFYQKLERKPKVWKAVVATFVGLFTFSFNFTMLGALVEIPILPLGVWVLYWYAHSRNGAWDKYRSFAWLGFVANFLFIVTAILSVFLHHLVFPKDDPSIYISNAENAGLLKTHPSGEEVVLDKENVSQALSSYHEEQVESIDWYTDITFQVEPHEREEKFPYHLIGTKPKWGSGLSTMIYIERDGKGILVDSSEKQRYFRTTESLLKGGSE
ncbi:hypothetical protein ACERII_00340 [Evansella sp. AB-rgal1]|uniref:hypothetical protein n=1 Tax=Evansella sp. AB-rgal1 TaxID=3242696 RepID=UPI00359DAC6B